MKFKRLTSESSVYTVYTKGNEEAQITKQKNSKSKRGDSAQRYFFFGRMSFSTQNHIVLRRLVRRVRAVLRLRALAQLGVAVAVGSEALVQLVRGERHHGEQQQRRQRHLRVHCLGQRRALLSEQQRLVLGAEPRLGGGGRLGGRHELAVGVGALAELALAGALALVASDLAAAHLVRLGGIAVAAAHLDRRGRRLGGRLLAVARVVRNQELAAHVLAPGAVRGAPALVVRLVAVVAVAAAHLLGRRGRGRPHRLAVLVLAEWLERAALHTVVVLEHQALRLGAEGLARLHPALAVRRVRVAVAAARLLGRLRRWEHAVLVQNTKCDERARRAAVALVRVGDGIARVIRRAARALAAARRLRRGRRLGGRLLAVARVVGHQELAAHVLAASAVRGAPALVVGFVAVVAVAAANLLGCGRCRGPHRLAILVLTHRLECAALLAVVVLEHQALALGGERLARLHPALAVRDVGVAVAAAWILRRLSRGEHAVNVENAERDERARRAAVALIRVRDGVARVVARAARAFAAAGRRRRGRRVGGGDHAVVFVIGHEPLAALALAARTGRR